MPPVISRSVSLRLLLLRLMTNLLMVKQGSVEHALTVPEGTLFSGLIGVLNEWEHKKDFGWRLASWDDTWMLDLDGTQLPPGDVPGETLVADVISSYQAPTLLLLQFVKPVLQLQVITADGDVCAPLVVSEGTAAEVVALLAAGFEGDLVQAVVQIPGLKAGSFLAFKLSSCEASASVLECAVAHVGKMVEFLRPPVPTDLTALRIKLPPGATRKVQQAGGSGDGASGGDGSGEAALEFQAKLAASLGHAIMTSKSGATADRELVKQVGYRWAEARLRHRSNTSVLPITCLACSCALTVSLSTSRSSRTASVLTRGQGGSIAACATSRTAATKPMQVNVL